LTTADRRALIEKNNSDITLGRQSELLGFSRSSLYYQPVIDPNEILIKEAIDRIYTNYPFLGSRKIRFALQDYDRIFIGRDQVRRLMREMGIEAIYPEPKNLSEPHPQHQKFPYLLTNLNIVRPNQVWGSDITYIKIVGGWAYLIAILDWFSRYVVAWTLAPTLEKEFVFQTYERALKIAVPEYSNSDQGSQYTVKELIDLLLSKKIKISMDGRGRCMDNIFTERLWRTVKYENVYPMKYESFQEAEDGLKRYFDFYNHERRHQALGYRVPAEIYLPQPIEKTDKTEKNEALRCRQTNEKLRCDILIPAKNSFQITDSNILFKT
jgi:putative transposase